jgi:uncharacterized membrane protein
MDFIPAARVAPVFDAVIHPYRSLGGEGFRLLLIAIVVANAAAAAVMVSQGAWPVAGFMGLDVLAVYVAFRLSYAQARAFERVTIDREALIVERVDRKGRRREWRFPSYWVHVLFEGDDEHGTVTLRSHGRALEVGAFLSPFERKAFAGALREALHLAKTSPAGA